MKYIAAFLVCLAGASYVQAGATLKAARQEWLGGYYDEARESYTKLAGDAKRDKDTKTLHAATLGLSRAWESKGAYEKAQTVIEALLKEMPKDADLLARLAELHHTRGRFEDAEKSATLAIEANKDHFLAHWVLAQVHRDRGDLKKADDEFLWFVRASNRLNITDPDQMRLTGLAALERARYLHLQDEFQTAINDYFNAAVKADKHYWPAEYEAGRVFMDKHNKPAAFRAFTRAMTINPLAVEVMTARGRMAVSSLEFTVAEKYATDALKYNPRYVPALCLMADVHWFTGDIDKTLEALTKAHEVNPRDEATLARLAACAFAQKKDAEFQALLKEAQKNNPKCYTFFTDLGSLLEMSKRNAEAEKYYRLAIDIQPKFPEAQTALGMLYMRSAKEDDARKVLEEAKKADPFNIRVSNSLKVLEHLGKYETLTTDHFTIRFDAKNDRVLANFMASYLEDIYKELAEQFDYRPKEKVQIEIFKLHGMFSGRIIAVPDLHTIGACTGPLVAMVSPRDATVPKVTNLFNWNRVVRHELVHVFNLQQTQGKVPHWFTEGLAVRYEGSHIPLSWHALLAEKYVNNELLNLDTILLGFIRPRSPLQWQQAYLQSLLYVEYLAKTHGEKSIGKMLAAFQDGLETGAALEKVCGVKKEAFEKGYREFLGERVKKLPARPAAKEMTAKQLKAAHDKNPDDADIAARLAEEYFLRGTAKQRKEAKELAEKVLREMPRHPTAAFVKALTLLDEKRQEDAYSLLDSVDTDELKDTKPLKLLVKMQLDAKKLEQAVRTCEHARKIDPNDAAWIVLLGKLYGQTKQKEKLVEIFEEVAKVDPDDLTSRKLLAKHYLELGKHAEAEKFARKGLEIDVLDADCQRIILEALPALDRQADADRLRKIFGL